MARNDPQINLRIPQELKERVEAAAVNNKRSMNAEIAARLEESFRPTPDEHIVVSSPEALREAMAWALREVGGRNSEGDGT